MAESAQKPSAKSAQKPPSTAPSGGGSHHRSGSGTNRPRTARGAHPAAMRRGHRHMSTRDINQMLAEMGSYTKYSKVVNDCNFDVKLRCQCGRSRNMSWMFLCTVCATGTKVEKAEDDSSTKFSSILHSGDSPLAESGSTDEKKDKNGKEDANIQRPFLSCDLCAHKITETYYCPNCLNAYPAQYVKQQTRCPRCVACPICVSPLEKIVYAGGTTQGGSSSSSSDAKDASKDVSKDSLAAPGAKPAPIKTDTEKDKRSKSKDTYLYQCPFCFWSSNSVGLEAPTSDVLLQNLNNKIKEPYDHKLKLMEHIEGKYNAKNEELRKEEERLHNARHYHKNYKKNLFDITKIGKQRKGSKDLDSSKQGSDDAPKLLLERVQSNEAVNAMERLRVKLDEKFKKTHVLPESKADNSHVPKLDMIFVSAFNIQHVSPLVHRLQDPLHQHTDFHKFIPQRFHLMTKESYKCPNPACEQYVCKPHLRGAQANFEKRTAVLDFLPRVVIDVVSGDLLASATSTILVKFQNRHMEDAKMTLDCSINEKDPFSTAKVECSETTFEMDPINIHIKGGAKKERKDENGDYVNGKEVGIHFKVTPKYYTQADIKFSVRVMFETTLEIKKDKAPPKKSDFKDIKFGLSGKQTNKQIVPCELPFILDFDLGSAKKLNPKSSMARKVSDAPIQPVVANTASKPSESASATPSTSVTASTSTSETPATQSANNAQTEAASASASADADAERGHKSRNSNEMNQTGDA